MKLDINNNFALGSSPLYKKQEATAINKPNIIERIEGNLKRRSDVLEISEQGQLKLKLRNLEQASALEERSNEIKETISDRIKLFETVKTTIQDIIELVKGSMDESISSEDRENIQSNINDIIKDIEGFVEEANKNKNKSNFDDIDISNNTTNTRPDVINLVSDKNSINNKENIDKDKIDEESSLEEIKEDQNKSDLSKIDIVENPKEALITLGNALGSIMEEIMKLTEQLSELEKNIEELLGQYDKRKEFKVKDLDELEDTTIQKNNESVQESKENKNKE